jgi:hypothetical protein
MAMAAGHIADWRMRSLRLSGEPLGRPEDVVGWLCAVQSQDYGPAKWSVGMRTTGVTDAALDDLFADGAILRTHVLRPTWHFVLPADICWLLELTAPRVRALSAFAYRSLGLDEAVRGRAASLLGEALVGGNPFTRQEAGALWERAGISVAGQRLPYLLMHAELEGVVCSAGLRGRQHTYALLDERAPHSRRLSREEALAELTRRYFTSHGPSTEKDFRAWSSLTAAEVQAGLAMAAAELDQAQVGERTYWFGEPPPAARAAAPTAHLLQGYDEYIVAYRDSRWVIDVAGAARVRAPRQAVSTGVVIVDGQVAGHWKRTMKARTVTVEVELYVPLSHAQDAALRREADRYGDFVGLTATVVMTPV